MKIIRMKTPVLSLFILLLACPAFAQSEDVPGPVWLPFEDARAEAAKDDKILLVNVYTDWCGYCKQMRAEVYDRPKVAETMREHFALTKINPENDWNRIKYEGKTYEPANLVKAMGGDPAKTYPTFLFLKRGASPESIEVRGFHDEEAFLKVLKDVRRSFAASEKK